MSNENIAYERAKIMLADKLLADFVDEKFSNSRAHLELYEITKDKNDLCEAENYAEQAKRLLEARRVLQQTIEKGIEIE